MPFLEGGWQTPDAAQGQCATIERELAQPDVLVRPPYREFVRALNRIPTHQGWRLLDVGCGVGHYGSILRSWFPLKGLEYHGTDASHHMVRTARAREPLLNFDERAFEENRFGAYEIVLQGLALEVSPNPVELAELMLEKSTGYVIWHRIRLAPTSGFITEPTYGGHAGHIWLWAEKDLEALLTKMCRAWSYHLWESRIDATILVRPRSASLEAKLKVRP